MEESFPTSKQGYTMGKLLDGTGCQILLDTRPRKSFMSKSHYLHCKSLHFLPKFVSKTQRIQAGNGQFISVLFTIPIIVDIHGHRFEIYTLVSDIHKNIDLVPLYTLVRIAHLVEQRTVMNKVPRLIPTHC